MIVEVWGTSVPIVVGTAPLVVVVVVVVVGDAEVVVERAEVAGTDEVVDDVEGDVDGELARRQHQSAYTECGHHTKPLSHSTASHDRSIRSDGSGPAGLLPFVDDLSLSRLCVFVSSSRTPRHLLGRQSTALATAKASKSCAILSSI